MSNEMIVRAWKDQKYRQTLSDAELASVPQNPAGLIELSDADLVDVSGDTCACVIVTVLTVAISASALFTCSVCG